MENNTNPVQLWLSVNDVADRLKVTPLTVRRWISSGRLIAYKPGQQLKIWWTDLDKFMEASKVIPKQ